MTDYEKMKNIIDEIDVLLSDKVTSSEPEFQAWKTKTERFLIYKYGKDSLEYKKFINTEFSLVFFGFNTPSIEFVKACQRGLSTTKAIFLTYLDEMKEEDSASSKPLVNKATCEKIFIVHGHDGELQQTVARLIEKQGIETIILSEQANKGKTIVEKLEENSDVSCAICLFTPDDTGKANDETDYKARARQNVVLEAGYFMGKLGREHVVILADKYIEMPSDLSGVVYTDTTSWQFNLLRELKTMGYKIDYDKLPTL